MSEKKRNEMQNENMNENRDLLTGGTEDVSGEDLYEKLERFGGAFHRMHTMNRRGQDPMTDNSRGQGRVIAALKLKDGVSTRSLAYLLGVRIGSLNEILIKLERGGYITRTPSEEDRRVVAIHLTDKGRETEPGGMEYGNVLDCLKEDEKMQFAGYLDRVTDSMESWIAEKDDGFREMGPRGGMMPPPPCGMGPRGGMMPPPPHGMGPECGMMPPPPHGMGPDGMMPPPHGMGPDGMMPSRPGHGPRCDWMPSGEKEDDSRL